MNTEPVQLRLFGVARGAVGKPVVHAATGTLAQVLEGLEQRHPAFTTIRPKCSFLLDGIAFHGDPTTVTVSAESTIDVLPLLAGG